MKKLLITLMVLSNFAVHADEFSEFETEATSSATTVASDSALNLSGFVDFEQGAIITDQGPSQEDGVERDYVLANRRLRLKSTKSFQSGSMYFMVDFNHDEVIGENKIDIREAKFVTTAGENTDLSIGRQVSTWGVGDLLFINDLFPKNWVANFQGREMDMLKDPADSLRVTHYKDSWTFDLVATPKFAPDTTPTGCRFSVFDPNQQKVVSSADACSSSNTVKRNGNSVDEGEVALSIKKKLGGHQLAIYGYKGFYKNPRGLQTGTLSDNSTGYLGYYPKLEVYGFSDEGQVGPGILSLEFGYYNSKEDTKGDDYLVENSTLRYLAGYKMDLSASFSFGVQWYQEKMLQYDDYKESYLTNNSANYAYRLDETRNTYTLRLGYKAMQDTLYINLFSYIRPEDKDAFHKIEVTKRVNDQMQLTVGANIFEGDDNYQDREFGMLKDSDNIFTHLKFVF